MSLGQIFTYLWMWALFIPLPIINGITREKLYRPIVGEMAANRISTVILSVILFIYTYLLLGNRVHNLSNWSVFFIGVFWVVLTVIFEFLFGHYVDKVSWQKLIENYNVLAGNWWSLFLLFESICPLLVKLVKDHWV